MAMFAFRTNASLSGFITISACLWHIKAVIHDTAKEHIDPVYRKWLYPEKIACVRQCRCRYALTEGAKYDSFPGGGVNSCLRPDRAGSDGCDLGRMQAGIIAVFSHGFQDHIAPGNRPLEKRDLLLQITSNRLVSGKNIAVGLYPSFDMVAKRANLHQCEASKASNIEA